MGLGMESLERWGLMALSAMWITPAIGMTFGGNKRRFIDILSVLEEGQHREDKDSVSKPKRWREQKNLECSINFDARGNGSSWDKSRASLQV
jgi:hypothetical protein